jgi:hypothetical protein
VFEVSVDALEVIGTGFYGTQRSHQLGAAESNVQVLDPVQLLL